MVRKKIKELFSYHETTRLLIRDLELRHTELVNRIRLLENKEA
jgi:hypothetical protein